MPFLKTVAHSKPFVLALAALCCCAAHAQNALPENDTELILFAPAPQFWNEVERVLLSDLELYWTNQGNLEGNAEYRQQVIENNLATLTRLKLVSLPKINGYKRVRVFPLPDSPKYSLLGFLIQEEPEAWSMFTGSWHVQRFSRSSAKIEPADWNGEIDAALAMARIVQGNRDRNRRGLYEIPASIKDSHNHFVRLELLFEMAYLAFASGRNDAVEPLLRAAFYQHAEILPHLYDALAWRQFESAVLDLNAGANRSGLARRFQRIGTEYSQGKHAKQATEYAQKLRTMAAEDARWQPAAALAQLPTAERVSSLIFELRNCSATQFSQPGACWIPNIFQPCEDPQANAADLLVAEGFDAVPALIAALEDSRLTRSYGFDRDFIPWRYVLEVRDAAIQSLSVIADDLSDRRLYFANNTGQYFSNDTAEARGFVISQAKKWWADARSMGEAEWLRLRLRNPGQSRSMLLRRLVRVEGEKAVPDVRRWLAEKNERTYAFRLLLRAGGTATTTELLRLGDATSTKFDFAALFALNLERKLTPEEYVMALLQGAKTVAERDADKLPDQVLTALTETGDRQCTLMVAERLRAGKSRLDLPMGWALSKIVDPQIGAEVAAYLLPFFDIEEIAADSGWRQHYEGKPDLYRIKDRAALAVNRLVGSPLPQFYDLTPPERNAEIEKLRRICAGRGIRPAFDLKGN